MYTSVVAEKQPNGEMRDIQTQSIAIGAVSYTHLKHNPEFTSIELYQAFTDFHGMMDLVEELYKRLAQKICGSMVIPYQEMCIRDSLVPVFCLLL